MKVGRWGLPHDTDAPRGVGEVGRAPTTFAGNLRDSAGLVTMAPSAPTTPGATSGGLYDSGDPPGSCEVAVIGGGIAGVCTALHMARAGVEVVLLEKSRIASGATGAAVGLLSPPYRQPFHRTVRHRGQAGARATWDVARRSVEGMVGFLEEAGAADDVGLDRSGGFVVAEAETLDDVRQAFEALQRAGVPAEWMASGEVAERSGFPCFPGGYHLPGPGALDPVRLTHAVAKAAQGAGARLVEEAEVRGVDREAGRFRVSTGRGDTRCEMVMYAVHAHGRRFSEFLGDEVVPIRGQGLQTHPRGEGEPGPPLGGWSTHQQLNAWRWTPAGALRMAGWRYDAWDRSYWKLRPDVDDALQEELEGWARRTFEGVPAVADRWGGVYGWSADHLPLVGPLPGRTGEMVVAGFSGSGIVLAWEAGRMMSGIVTGAPPRVGQELFNPRRFT